MRRWKRHALTRRLGPHVVAAGALGAQLLTGLSAAIVGHVAGAASLGEVATVLGLVAIVSDTCDFGTGVGLSRDVASGEVSAGDAIALLRNRLSVCLVPAAVAIVCVVVFDRSRLSLVAAASCYLITFTANLGANNVLRACAKYSTSAFNMVTDRLVTLIGCCLAAAFGQLSPITFVASLAVGSAVAVLLAYRGLGLGLWAKADVRVTVGELYRRFYRLGINNIATDLTILETPLVTLGAGATAAGYYGAASRLTSPIPLLAGGSSAYLLRTTSRLQTDPREAVRHLWAQARVIGITALVVAVAAALGGWLVPLVFGREFAGTAVTVFRLLCLTALISVCGQLLYTTLIGLRLERRALACQWTCIPLGLLLTLAGAGFGGAPYAVAGGLLAQVAQAMWLGLVLRRAAKAVQDSPINEGAR